MQDRQGQHRLQRWTGNVLLTLGLLGECTIGMLLLTGADMQLLLLHIPVVLLWALGVNLIDKQQVLDERAIRIGRIHLHKWSIAALLLSWCTFPCFGPLAYSIALCTVRRLYQGATIETPEVTAAAHELSPPLDLEVQPLIDVLHTSDLETRRAAVAALSRQVNPAGIQLLRQLLSDAQPEIRSDASIALTRLEEELAGALNASLELWTADPANMERTRNLADRYYEYACSNVLDEKSQHCYFAKARDVLQQCIRRDNSNAHLWLKLARIGEAESYRWYWQQEWKEGTPAWLGMPDPGWEKNYWVHYWDPDWQHLIHSYLDAIIAVGFDGVYLDRVDAYQEDYAAGHEDDMVRFVTDIAHHARSHSPLGEDFGIIVQNAEELAADHPHYVRLVTGIGREEAYIQATNRPTSQFMRAKAEHYLDRFRRNSRGKLVLTVDYATSPDLVRTAYQRARTKEYIPYVTRVELNGLPDQP